MKVKHLIVRSRNTTCSPLRELVVPRTTILRLGSITPTDKITKCKDPIEINTWMACANSADKRLMKPILVDNEVPTAEYIVLGVDTKENYIKRLTEKLLEWNTIICKKYNSSKGKGIYLLKTKEDIEEWANNNHLHAEDFLFEKYYTYSREYRLHITKDGCFYACRKMLYRDAEVRWHRHDANCCWITEENELFNRPTNWDDIVASCVKALEALSLDLAAFDIKVQNDKHKTPKYIILESNSAPSLGELGVQKYKEQLNKMIYGN